jgi:hypothetical protein
MASNAVVSAVKAACRPSKLFDAVKDAVFAACQEHKVDPKVYTDISIDITGSLSQYLLKHIDEAVKIHEQV